MGSSPPTPNVSVVRRMAASSPLFLGDGSDAFDPVRLAKLAAAAAEPSAQGAAVGEKFHPFDLRAISRYMVANTHHSACILTKRDAIVGLGFENESVVETLDELTDDGFQPLLNRVGEAFVQTGVGYIEVVRRLGAIRGLHYLPPEQTTVFVENSDTLDYHYRIRPDDGGRERAFARFGDLDAMTTRLRLDPYTTSEVIAFKDASSLSRWYGLPGWLSAAPSIELTSAILQHNYDFFMNRGVPEFMFIVTGGQVAPEEWKKIEEALRAHIGLGNSHKTLAINLASPNIKVQIEKLNIEGGNTEAVFESMLNTLALNIVSAHRVPPLLAGIQIPGKLGASNELANALTGFQALLVGQAQETFASTLGKTLGDLKLGVRQGVRGRKAFTLKKITDYVNVAAVDAASQTRTPVGGKDPNAPATPVSGTPNAQRAAGSALKKMLERNDAARKLVEEAMCGMRAKLATKRAG